jgi:hypothetical protein
MISHSKNHGKRKASAGELGIGADTVMPETGVLAKRV